jgi:hypothetical protein
MGRGASTFRIRDLTRVLRGIIAAGVAVARVKIENDGGITVDVESSGKPAEVSKEDREKEWDNI